MKVDGNQTQTATAGPDVRSSGMGNAARLEMVNVEKRYGDVAAVSDISLTVEPGEWLTLLGPSGSGKSTTLAMVAGFEQPTNGLIMLGERDITHLVTHKRDLGMVFQGYALFPHMTVFDNVAFPLTLRKMNARDVRTRVMEALESVSLGGFAKRKPSQLSGGQQQRVALARAFVHRPPILLMDEPLSALDKALRGQMQAELRRLHQELGTTVLFVTHDQEEALGLSDRIVVMNEGCIAQAGTPVEMYERPQSEFVAGFLGAANMLPGEIVELLPTGEATVALATGERAVAVNPADLQIGEKVQFVLRPEDATIGGVSEVNLNEFTALITDMVYLGERIRCAVRFGDGTSGVIWIDHEQNRALRVGDSSVLRWPAERCVAVPMAD